MPFDPIDAVRNPHPANPLKSGIYSIRDFVRKGQEKEYANSLINLMTELSPEGVLEECFATEIFKATWRLRRCRNVEFDLAESTEQDPMIDEQTSLAQKTVDRARTQSHYLLRRSISELTKLQTNRTIRMQLEAGDADLGLADLKQLFKTLKIQTKGKPQEDPKPADALAALSALADKQLCQQYRESGMSSFCNPASNPEMAPFCKTPVGQVSDLPAPSPDASSFCKADETAAPSTPKIDSPGLIPNQTDSQTPDTWSAGSFCKTTQPNPQMRNRDQVIGSKTPRNAPCPCGSGTKFKKCCGNETNPAVKEVNATLNKAA